MQNFKRYKSLGQKMLQKISDKDYRKIPAISQSSIVQALNLSPAEWRRRQEEPFEPTPKMQLGTLIHAMHLEPETVSSNFRRVPKLDRRKTEHKLLAAELESETRICIDDEMWDQAEIVIKKLETTKAAWQLFEVGQAEVSITDQEAFGAKVKGKIDFLRLHEGIIIDLKTTELDLSDDALKWTMDQKHYKVQAAFYIDLMRRETARDDWSFCFFFVNVKPPFEMRKVVVSDLLNPDWIDEGRELYQTGIEKILSWKESNVYPSLIEMPAFIPQSKPWRSR